jgi:hypothetical protein
MPKVNRHKARYRAYRMGAKPTLRKGVAFRSIIATAFVRPNNEYALHATKGYRWRRLPPNTNALLTSLIAQLS